MRATRCWTLPLFLTLLLWCPPAHAQTIPSDTTRSGDTTTALVKSETDLEAVGGVLVVFLTLSLVFESAMSVIFNWRWFLARFEGKGIKTPLIIGTAFVVFWGYGLDVVHDLLTALGYQVESNLGGQILTALLIAGGSDGIFRIFARLGIRSPAERARKAREARAALAAAQQQDEPVASSN